MTKLLSTAALALLIAGTFGVALAEDNSTTPSGKSGCTSSSQDCGVVAAATETDATTTGSTDAVPKAQSTVGLCGPRIYPDCPRYDMIK